MIYDTIIIGCGPAGMTAALYLLRNNKKVLILEKNAIGGSLGTTPLISNYPGVKEISGTNLSRIMFEQIDELNVSFELEEVIGINIKDNLKEVKTIDNIYLAKTVIIATGSKYKRLNLENEEELIGKGLHFCVSCDGVFYKNKNVAIIGGGNSAVVNAISLASLANKVTIIQNLEKLTCERELFEKLKNISNIDIIYNANIVKYHKDNNLIGLELSNKEILYFDGVFLNIGLIPQNNFIKDLIDLDTNGYVKSDYMKTNIDGIYVIGDARSKKYLQATIAVSDGTCAALDIIDYLNKAS